MTAPAFEFTSRATPIVQMGRSAHNDVGNMWGDGLWGSGLWGVKDWEVIWADLACEVHEITVNTGRGGATERFVPGTAAIVASNVNQISELIFPQVPETGEGIELVPQPPVTHEEELQAPAAETIVSTGWSFSDDFERAPPRWIFPPAWATTGTFPCGPFKQLAGDVWAPPVYRDPALTGGTWYEGSAAAQWTGPYTVEETCRLTITVAPVNWPAATTAGTPTVVYELYGRMNRVDKHCQCLRVTYTPGFSGADNVITLDLFRMAADGSRAVGGTAHTVNLGATNGAFPAATFGLHVQQFGDGSYTEAHHNGAMIYNFVDTAAPTGTRLGLFCRVAEGKHTGTHVIPQITAIGGLDFDDDLTRPTGSGWFLPKTYARHGDADPMIVTDGGMRPPETFTALYDGLYQGNGVAYFDAEFEGDQVFEFDLTNMSMPHPLGGPTETIVEVMLHGNRRDQSSIRCSIDYIPDWDGGDNTISWEIYQAGPLGDRVYDPDVWGDIDLGPTEGVFPEPATWRVESDANGDTRFYLNGDLLGTTAVFPNPPTGGQVGVSLNWKGGGPAAGDPRPTVARILEVRAGLASPLGTEELGMWVRIGVDHDVYGNCWFFRGFVDAVVPTYVPDRQDAVRIECVDSLGEAGRVYVAGDELPHPFADAPTRIRQVLTAAAWPAHFRTVHDDSTFMSRPSKGKAVDALTLIAESCGGAVYGDPTTGDVVFKGQDWQGPAAGGEVQAFITNYFPAEDDGILRVCPTGWERSSRRSDMCTRVRYATVTADTETGDPIVREWKYPAAERLYGVEKYERTLLCITRERLDELGIRQLRLRQPNQFPRIEAVVLDAATATEALDLMSTVSFTGPSKVQCQLRRDGVMVFNRKMLVTGVRHRMTPTRWSCRLALDPSSAFAEVGGRWDEARWGHDEWGRTR